MENGFKNIYLEKKLQYRPSPDVYERRDGLCDLGHFQSRRTDHRPDLCRCMFRPDRGCRTWLYHSADHGADKIRAKKYGLVTEELGGFFTTHGFSDKKSIATISG